MTYKERLRLCERASKLQDEVRQLRVYDYDKELYSKLRELQQCMNALTDSEVGNES